jgi:fusion and transport protein UGO1
VNQCISGNHMCESKLNPVAGLLTSCVHNLASSTLQPIIHASLRSLIIPYLIPYSHSSSILVPLTSHVLTGLILSPLDLIRTRLVVQSASSRYTQYSGPIDAFRQIIRDEGGLPGLYFHPHLFIPTILDTGAAAFAVLALPRFLARVLGAAHIAPDTHPLAWAIAEFSGSCVGLLITLPLETVRRRLQVQVRGQARPLRTCVETRPAPYNGVVDAMWHIITEERSDLPLKPRLRRRKSVTAEQDEEQRKRDKAVTGGWMRNTGVGQLYRGLGLRVTASVLVFVVSMVSGGEEPELGWTEL